MRKRTGYLLQRGKVFYAVWTVSGKKFMRTTGKRDRREAETELRKIMEPFTIGDEVTTLQNIAARIEGRTAELARLDDERNPPLTLSAAWTAYLAAPGRPDSGPATQMHYEGHFSAFADWLKNTHPNTEALRDVTPGIVGEYTLHLTRERGLSANSFNKHVRLLELLWRVLKTPGRLTINPWEEIQRKRVTSASRREFTTDELKAVCSTASGDLRVLFAVGIYTGLRLGDCATLRWAEVDLQRRMIRRIPNKIARRSPRPVIIPVHPSLAAMLNETQASKEAEYVLPEVAALYLGNAPALSYSIQAHFKGCGIRTIKQGTGPGTGKRAVVEVGFHSLRHTFVSLCRESNAPLSVVESIVGHSNPAMTRHYTHTSEMAATLAVNNLPAVMGETSVRMLPMTTPDTSLKAELLTLAGQLNSNNWKKIKADMLQLAEKTP